MKILTIDESLIAYHPSSIVKEQAEINGEPIPVIYIPRKPHKNGLLIYYAMTFINHPVRRNSVLPFIIDTIPHLQVRNNDAVQVVEKIINM